MFSKFDNFPDIVHHFQHLDSETPENEKRPNSPQRGIHQHCFDYFDKEFGFNDHENVEKRNSIKIVA